MTNKVGQDINNFIDKLHFKTYNHLIDKLKASFPDVDEKELNKIIDSRLKDHYVKLRKIEPYYIKIFSTKPNCWFHDLIDNGKFNNPRYWHVFIGTNTHYAVAYPLSSKSAVNVRSTLERFINEYHPVKLERTHPCSSHHDSVFHLFALEYSYLLKF